MANSADPEDLDLHCLQMQGISGLSRTRVNRDIKRLYCIYKFFMSAIRLHYNR